MKTYEARAKAFQRDEYTLQKKHLIARVPQIVLSESYWRRLIGKLGVLLLKWSKATIISVAFDTSGKEPSNK